MQCKIQIVYTNYFIPCVYIMNIIFMYIIGIVVFTVVILYVCEIRIYMYIYKQNIVVYYATHKHIHTNIYTYIQDSVFIFLYWI